MSLSPHIASIGDCESLRGVLGPSYILKPCQWYWLTDTTPHESLPLSRSAYRQYIRVVTGEISIWYSQHNTANPTGITPGRGCVIYHGNKFDSEKPVAAS